MTYLPHWRATFKGEFKAGNQAVPYEHWNTSIALKPGGEWSTASAQGVADDLRADFSAFIDALGPRWSNNTFLTEVRLDSIGANGRITQDAVFSLVENGGKGGSGGLMLPSQCAVVLTLDTKTRGRSRFGRMYLPLLAMSPAQDGVLSEANATAVLEAARTFITNVSNAPGVDAGFAAVVASGVGGGSLNEVQEVRVGRAIDTMRSRRRSLDESYVSGTVSA